MMLGKPITLIDMESVVSVISKTFCRNDVVLKLLSQKIYIVSRKYWISLVNSGKKERELYSLLHAHRAMT